MPRFRIEFEADSQQDFEDKVATGEWSCVEVEEQQTQPANVLQLALDALRKMYDGIESGDYEDTDDLLADESLWPLTALREALEDE